MDPLHRLDNMRSQFALVAFCRNSEASNVWNGAVIEVPAIDRWLDDLVLCYPSCCIFLY